MEKRPYFIFGDLVASLAAGGAVGLLVWWGVPAGWWMGPAMVAGMVVGMIAAILIGLMFAPFFGSFELLMPVSLSGMATGMVVVMRGIDAINATQAVCTGITVGIVSLALTYLLQARLHGEVT